MHLVRTATSGFTLIELMFVVVIIAILLMVAVPMYQESMNKSRRTDGMRDLMDLASREERFYAQNQRYTIEISGADGLNLERTESSERHYNLIAGPGACGDINRCYKLSAIPKGVQDKDTGCGTLSVDSLGQRKASGSLGDTCW